MHFNMRYFMLPFVAALQSLVFIPIGACSSCAHRHQHGQPHNRTKEVFLFDNGRETLKRVELIFTKGHCQFAVESVEEVGPHLTKAPHGWFPELESCSLDCVVAAVHNNSGHFADDNFSQSFDEHRSSTTVHAFAEQCAWSQSSPSAPHDNYLFQSLVTFIFQGRRYLRRIDDPRRYRVHQMEGEHAHVTASGGSAARSGDASTSGRFDIGSNGVPEIVEATVEWEVGGLPLFIPASVSAIDIYCHVVSKPAIRLSVDIGDGEYAKEGLPRRGARSDKQMRRAFGALQAEANASDDDVEMQVLQQVGPTDTQYSIIFLAAGYMVDEKEKFFSDVKRVADMLIDDQMSPDPPAEGNDGVYNLHRSVPYNRYWSFFNVFAVYQPSVESGASRPLYNKPVKNNLKCEHPADAERGVGCDTVLTRALAAVAPSRVKDDPDRNLIVVLVNTPIYGGTGISYPGHYRICHFFNGYDLSNREERRRMLSLVDHEFGHAMGDLLDEYNIGRTGSTQYSNCQQGSGSGPPTSLQWQHWLDIKNGDPQGWKDKWSNGLRMKVQDSLTLGVTKKSIDWGVLDRPEPICGFTNYYKSNSQCAMHRLDDYFFCPVCREASTLVLLARDPPFQLDWPRFPLRDIVTIIPIVDADPNTLSVEKCDPALNGADDPTSTILSKKHLVLHLPPVLTTRNAFTVTVKDSDGEVLQPLNDKGCNMCFLLDKRNFDKYPLNTEVKVTVTIEDRTNFISPTRVGKVRNQLYQTSSFRIMKTNDIVRLNETMKGAIQVHEGSANIDVGRHADDLLKRYYLCQAEATVDPSGISFIPTGFCSIDFTNNKYDRPLDLDGLLSSVNHLVLGGFALLAMLFIFAWMIAASRLSQAEHYNNMLMRRPKSVYENVCLHRVYSVVYYIMLLTATLILVGCLVCIGFFMYMYYRAHTGDDAVLGKWIIIAGIICATILYFIAFIGYWSVRSRTMCMLITNFIVLLLSAAVSITLFIIAESLGGAAKGEDNIFKLLFNGDSEVVTNYTIIRPYITQGLNSNASNLNLNATQGANEKVFVALDQSDFWFETLASLWRTATRDNPSVVCAFQKYLQCSGFFQDCTSFLNFDEAYCPSNCDATNERYPIPCASVVQVFIAKHYRKIALSLLFISVAIIVGALFTALMIYVIQKRRREIKAAKAKQVKKYLQTKTFIPPTNRRGLRADLQPEELETIAASFATFRNHRKKSKRRSSNYSVHDSNQSNASAEDGVAVQTSKYRVLYLLQSLDHAQTERLLKEFKRFDQKMNCGKHQLMHVSADSNRERSMLGRRQSIGAMLGFSGVQGTDGVAIVKKNAPVIETGEVTKDQLKFLLNTTLSLVPDESCSRKKNDEDQTGSIEETDKGVTAAELDLIFQHLDTESSGKICYLEFLALFGNLDLTKSNTGSTNGVRRRQTLVLSPGGSPHGSISSSNLRPAPAESDEGEALPRHDASSDPTPIPLMRRPTQQFTETLAQRRSLLTAEADLNMRSQSQTKRKGMKRRASRSKSPQQQQKRSGTPERERRAKATAALEDANAHTLSTLMNAGGADPAMDSVLMRDLMQSDSPEVSNGLPQQEAPAGTTDLNFGQTDDEILASVI